MYAQNPFPDDSGNSDMREGASYVSIAAAKQYGWSATTAALNKVHEQTGRDVREKVTRGDLELIQRELVMQQHLSALGYTSKRNATYTKGIIATSSQTFTEIYSKHKPSPIESDQPLRGKLTKDGYQVYARNPLVSEPEEAPRAQNEIGAKLVKQAIATEYGDDIAQDVFRHVSRMKGRNLDSEITRRDLETLHDELLGPAIRGAGTDADLDRDDALPMGVELQKLQNNVRNDTTAGIKCDLISAWYTHKKDLWVHAPDRRDRIYDRCIRHCIPNNNIVFVGGELILTTQSGRGDSDENKKMALAAFIQECFNVGPGQPESKNIAINIISYLHPARLSNITPPPLDDIRRTVKLSIDKEKHCNVRVVGEVSWACRAPAEGILGSPIDSSKYMFVRREAFEISGANLRSDPWVFYPTSCLLSVDRFDTIEVRQGI
jgi:hypothetical protein